MTEGYVTVEHDRPAAAREADRAQVEAWLRTHQPRRFQPGDAQGAHDPRMSVSFLLFWSPLPGERRRKP